MRQHTIFLPVYLVLLLSVILNMKVNAQLGLSLQVEVVNSLDKVEFYQGQKMEFTLKSYPDEWRKDRISKILVKDQVIIFDGEIVALDQIDKIRTPNYGGRVLGGMLFTFGASWNLFGIITKFNSGFEFNGSDLFIGLGSMTVGFLISKLLRYHTYIINKGSRLRIIDRRFRVEESEDYP